jgi:hypothetical protein
MVMQFGSLILLDTSGFALPVQADEMSILLSDFNRRWSQPEKFINISKINCVQIGCLLIYTYRERGKMPITDVQTHIKRQIFWLTIPESWLREAHSV